MSNVNVTFGVNDMNLDLAGTSLATAKNNLRGVLGLAGDEEVRVNGSTPPSEYILQDGDDVEFVKVSGSKGAVDIVAGVNDMSLDIAGKTVGQVRSELGSTLGINSDWRSEVNGESVTNSYVLEDGDELEFVKASGSKGK